MKRELKARWVAALRSGTYEQGRSQLRNCANDYCCLGVLADLYDPEGWRHRGNDLSQDFEWNGEWSVFSDSQVAELGLDGITVNKLVGMNDGVGGPLDPEHTPPQSFQAIADWIEQAIQEDEVAT